MNKCVDAKYHEHIYCAVNKDGEIQWVLGSSKKTRYFRTTRYLKEVVRYHNKYHADDPWRVQGFVLIEVGNAQYR